MSCLAGLILLLTGSALGIADDFTLSSELRWRSALEAASSAPGKFHPAPLESTAAASGERRSPTFFKSLLIPGWAQYSQGRKAAGNAFIAVEVLLVGGLLAQNYYQGWLEDDYRAYARQHAGITGDKPHQYYLDLGNWMNQDEYNQQRLRYRQFDDLYTSPSDAWQWDSDDNRRHFKSVRRKADLAGQRALLFGGGMLVNHIISMVEASRGEKRMRMGVTATAEGTPQAYITLIK